MDRKTFKKMLFLIGLSIFVFSIYYFDIQININDHVMPISGIIAGISILIGIEIFRRI